MFYEAQQLTALCSPEIYALMVPPCTCMCPSFVAGLTTVGMLVGGVGSQPVWLPCPPLCSGCWLDGGWGRVLSQLAVWPKGSWG